MKKIFLILSFLAGIAAQAQNVGIGTTSPQQQLSVNYGINVDQAALNANGLTYGIRFGSSSGEGIASNRANNGPGTNYYGLDLYTANIQRLTISNNGNIGIGGLLNPGFPLNFIGTLGDKISLLGNAGTHYGFGIQSHLLQIHTDTATSDIAFGYGSSAAFTENVRIKGIGKLGVNTDPGFALDVFDKANQGFMINFASNNANNSFVQIQANAPSPNTANVGVGLYRNSGAVGYWYTNGSNKMILSANSSATEHIVITPTGNIGFSESNPGFPLNFESTLGDKISLYGNNGNSYGFGIQNNLLQIHSDIAGTDIGLGYGSSATFKETMRIKGNGNVGIGTTNPGAKLQIVQKGLYTRTEGGGNALELWDTIATDHILYMGADATNQVGYIQSVAQGGYRDLLLQGRGGNVVVGKDASSILLVKGDLVADYSGNNNGNTSYALRFGTSSSGEAIGSKRTSGGNQNGLDIYTAGISRIQITNSGDVTIPGNLTVTGYQTFVSDINGQRQKIITGDAGLSSPAGGAAPGFVGTGVFNIGTNIFTSKPIAWVTSFTSTSGECKKMLFSTEVVASGSGWSVNINVINPTSANVTFAGVWKLAIMGAY